MTDPAVFGLFGADGVQNERGTIARGCLIEAWPSPYCLLASWRTKNGEARRYPRGDTNSRTRAPCPCPAFKTTPFVIGPPLKARRVAIVSSAGLLHRGDRPFLQPLHDGPGEYRAVSGAWDTGDILVSHASVNFDRAGFQRDINVVFPIDRLRDLVAAGAIGSVADLHYTFIPVAEAAPVQVADGIADALHADNVNAVVLAPV